MIFDTFFELFFFSTTVYMPKFWCSDVCTSPVREFEEGKSEDSVSLSNRSLLSLRCFVAFEFIVLDKGGEEKSYQMADDSMCVCACMHVYFHQNTPSSNCPFFICPHLCSTLRLTVCLCMLSPHSTVQAAATTASRWTWAQRTWPWGVRSPPTMTMMTMTTTMTTTRSTTQRESTLRD